MNADELDSLTERVRGLRCDPWCGNTTRFAHPFLGHYTSDRNSSRVSLRSRTHPAWRWSSRRSAASPRRASSCKSGPGRPPSHQFHLRAVHHGRGRSRCRRRQGPGRHGVRGSGRCCRQYGGTQAVSGRSPARLNVRCADGPEPVAPANYGTRVGAEGRSFESSINTTALQWMYPELITIGLRGVHGPEISFETPVSRKSSRPLGGNYATLIN